MLIPTPEISSLRTFILPGILVFFLLGHGTFGGDSDHKEFEDYKDITSCFVFSSHGYGLSYKGVDALLEPEYYGLDDPLRMIANLRYCGWLDKSRVLGAYKYAADNGTPESLFRYALMVLKYALCGTECPEAIRALKIASKMDFVPAFFLLGFCHENGLGVFLDYDEAAKWYSKIPDNSKYSEKAKLSLANCLIESNHLKEAEEILTPWVENRLPYALFLKYKLLSKNKNINLGILELDSEEGLLLEEAYEKGDLEAAVELGLYYFFMHFGKRATQYDPVKIRDVVKEAVKQNHPRALQLMSFVTQEAAESFESVSEEKENAEREGLAYYLKAIEYGDDYNRFFFATYRYEDEKYETAFQTLRPLILKKDPGALRLAGAMLFQGTGVEKDIPRAYRYLTLAKKLEHDNAVCDEILSQISPIDLYRKSPAVSNEDNNLSENDIELLKVWAKEIEKDTPIARLLNELGTLQDSTDSFEDKERRLSRIKPEACDFGTEKISASEMDFLLTLFKLEFCSVLRKGRKTIMYAEQLEYILQTKKIDIEKLSRLFFGVDFFVMKEVNLARADVIKSTPENSITRLQELLMEYSDNTAEYNMLQYTLGSLYFRAGRSEEAERMYKSSLRFFLMNELYAYAAIVANRLSLATSFANRATKDTWLHWSYDYALKTNSTLVQTEYWLQKIFNEYTVFSREFANENIIEDLAKNKEKILLGYGECKKNFMSLATSDYYLRFAYWCFSEIEYGLDYPLEQVLDSVEKYFLYNSLIVEGTEMPMAESFKEYVDYFQTIFLKDLAKRQQFEELNFWTQFFERLRIRERHGTEKMTVLEQMVSRLENANQILFLEEKKEQAKRDKRLILMAREVKNELENYFDSLRYRLDNSDREKLERILSDNFIIDPSSFRQLSSVFPEDVACVQLIFAGDALIFFIVARDKTPLIHITSLHQQGVSEKQLKSLIIKTRSLLQQNADVNLVKDHLRRLYDMLWSELDNSLQMMGVKKVLINSSGILRYLPFASLWDGKQYLIEKYQVTNVTGLDLIRLTIGAKSEDFTSINAAVFADPDGTLPFAREEGQKIAQMFLHKNYYAGDDATFSEFETLLGEVNFVHLATHAVLDPIHPEDSYILFSHGEQWRYSEMNTFNIKNVYSFVLSACETAVSEKITGGEIEGMAYNLLSKSPAGSVLASFWKVDDAATAELMATYYAHIVNSIMANGTLDRGGALREAQLKLLADPKTSAPYYWAAFTLFGDFR